MEEKKDHRRTGFPQFIRYRENNLTGREKNEFERELQKDPFAADAEEGFSQLPAGEMEKDMQILSGRLKKRTVTGRESRRVIYRIAAAIALLAGVSAILLLVNRAPEKSIAENAGKVALNNEKISENNINKTEAPKKDLETPAPVISQKKPPVSEGQIRQVISEKKEFVKEKTVQNIIPDTAKEELVADRLNMVAAEKVEEAISQPVARSISPVKKTHEIRGKITSSDDQLPIPGVTVTLKGSKIGTVTNSNGDYLLNVPEKSSQSLVASYIGMVQKEVPVKGDSVVNMSLEPSVAGLSEVVVTGYSARKAAVAGRDQNVSSYEEISIPPEPVNGKSAFDNYIRNSIRKPAEYKPGGKEVVVLSFLVRADGTVDSIRTIRSPGQAYTDEAIRLLRDGPAWKPATDNGKAVESTARIRIVFR